MAEYAPFDVESLRAWLGADPELNRILGGQPAGWRIQEVGDGNLNLVFLIDGEGGGLCVKQALPYVRLVGPGWPLPAERASYEAAYFEVQAPHVGRLVPELHRYVPELYCLVMERLSPHIIMRRGMIAAAHYPRFAGDMATYLARSLFLTSDLAMPAGEKRRMVARFSTNTALCKISEDLIFTEPYQVHEHNRWTSPQLDAVKAAFEQDAELKLAVQHLKEKFLVSAEALLHGDLHTGSIMVTPEDTRVIDPEFAFVGPMGFDIGALLGNLLINYFAQDGHEMSEDPRDEYRAWVLTTVEEVWRGFAAQFLELWRTAARGDLYPAALFADAAGQAALEAERQRYMARLLADSLGFAGAKMTRRILGLAHNIDLEWIANPEVRAACERRCLALSRRLVIEAASFTRIEDVTEAARAIHAAS